MHITRLTIVALMASCLYLIVGVQATHHVQPLQYRSNSHSSNAFRMVRRSPSPKTEDSAETQLGKRLGRIGDSVGNQWENTRRGAEKAKNKVQSGFKDTWKAFKGGFKGFVKGFREAF
ncbi:hypothetical protein ACQY0O_007226 [Thecaphora frezii]